VSCGQDSETPSNAPDSVDAFSYGLNSDFVMHGGHKYLNGDTCDAIPASRDNKLFAYAGSTAQGPAAGTCVRGSLASFKLDGGKRSCDWCASSGEAYNTCGDEVMGGTTSSCCAPVTTMQEFKHWEKSPMQDDKSCFRAAVGETQACNSNFDLLIYQCTCTSSDDCKNADGNLEIFKIFSRHTLTETSSAKSGCLAWFSQADVGVRDLVGQLRATIMADASEELAAMADACVADACHITMAGRPSRASSLEAHPEQCTADGNTAAVRCCDDSGGGYSKLGCSNSNCCNNDKTYTEAVALCSAQGYRLCTKDELDQTRGSGCGFDNKRTWTSSQ